MSEQDERKEEKKERKFSQEQYDMLLRCSEKKDVTEWNEWRKKNRLIEVHLEGAGLEEAHLEGVKLFEAHLESVNLWKTHLEGANLQGAHLEVANLWGVHLEGADIFQAHLEGASLIRAHLEGANLQYAHLEGARLIKAHLEGANLQYAHLEGADFFYAHMEGADFFTTVLDDKTLIWDCTVDRKTDFRGVGLGNVRIDPATRALLEYNVRRKNWEEWYQKKKWYRGFVQLFWWVSDYGLSTPQILKVFFSSAFCFALLYYLWGFLAPPGIVENLFEVAGVAVPGHVVPVRAFYFSVVTMTTLGFGDLHANPTSVWGHLFLAVQVILGYGILGALITRLNILFTTGGPSGDFTKPGGRKTVRERFRRIVSTLIHRKKHPAS